MRPGRFLPLSLIAITLGACSMLPQWFGGEPVPAPMSSTGTSSSTKVSERKPVVAPRVVSVVAPRVVSAESNGAYRLDSGDRVRVVVAGQDALSNSYDVDAGGAIEMSSIGRVSARGLNTVQLSSAIERKLRQSNVREAHVAVQIETFRPFTIRGEVANPGQYPYVNNMTTETAIAIAGGLKPKADKNSVIISNGENDDNPPTASLPESPVRPGDTVVVPEER